MEIWWFRLRGLEPAAYALRMRALSIYINDLAIFFLRFSYGRIRASAKDYTARDLKALKTKQNAPYRRFFLMKIEYLFNIRETFRCSLQRTSRE